MSATEIILAGLISASVSVALQPLVRKALLARNVIDVPNERSSHGLPTPRGGGVGMAVAVAAAALLIRPSDGSGWAWLAVAGFALLGLLDDVTSALGSRARLGIQAVLALLLVGTTLPLSPWWALAALAVVGHVNAVNFMDGINGISGITGTICGLQLVALGWVWGGATTVVLGAACAGASLGFLPFNLPRARLFMGDVGSYGMGALLGWGYLLAWAAGAPLVLVLAGPALYIADTGATLVGRLRRGADVFSAHREHVYQRLATGSRGHGSVAVLVGGLTVLNLLAGSGGVLLDLEWLAAVAVVALCVGYLVLPAGCHGFAPTWSGGTQAPSVGMRGQDR